MTCEFAFGKIQHLSVLSQVYKYSVKISTSGEALGTNAVVLYVHNTVEL